MAVPLDPVEMHGDLVALEPLNHRHRDELADAVLDGILRSHTRTRNGALRDTCVYSITASEWPAVEAGLEHRLARHLRSNS